jgi:hypothetical protein
MQIHTRTWAWARYLATIGARGDPRYAATSVMLDEPHCAWRWTATISPTAPAS